MTYSSIKILIFIFVYVFMLECDGLSWLKTNILVTKFRPKQKIIPPPHAMLSLLQSWNVTTVVKA